MSTSSKLIANGKDKPRNPIRLSKDEALYPPDPRALRITVVAIAVAIIAAIAAFALFPIS